MKLLTSLINTLLLTVLSAVLSCSSGSTILGEDQSAHAGPADKISKPLFNQSAVATVYDHYMHVLMALGNSDGKEAQLGAFALQATLKKLNRLKGARLAGKIGKTSNINLQRTEFDNLSAEIEELVKASELKGGSIYKQYCPLARKGKGGYWLTHDTTYKNPYGDQFSDCQQLKEEIK